MEKESRNKIDEQHGVKCCNGQTVLPVERLLWGSLPRSDICGWSLFSARTSHMRTFSMYSKTEEGATVAGASSMIFWCLRWMEQSRLNKEMAFPYWSAKTWTSRWRACCKNFITKMGDPGTSLCTCWTKGKKIKQSARVPRSSKQPAKIQGVMH